MSKSYGHPPSSPASEARMCANTAGFGFGIIAEGEEWI